MTVQLDFDVDFHGPFHVATGTSDLGSDRTVDRRAPLPASSLKGLMRAHAHGVLKIHDGLVEQIFGARGRSSSWAWSDASFDTFETRRAARIRISDGESGLVDERFLMIGEHVWASSATFSVRQLRSMSVEDSDAQQLVLRAAALSISALGGGRRRGEGWVSIRPTGADGWTWQETVRLMRLRGTGR